MSVHGNLADGDIWNIYGEINQCLQGEIDSGILYSANEMSNIYNLYVFPHLQSDLCCL